MIGGIVDDMIAVLPLPPAEAVTGADFTIDD
jgi:hypothetical protein